MIQTCKFCGKVISTAAYLTDTKRSCGLCSSYCMKECTKASKTTMSWHKEPCISCEHNPYSINHHWNGKEWKKNDRS